MRADPGEHPILPGGEELGVDEADVQDQAPAEIRGGRQGEGAGGETDDGGEGGTWEGEEEEAGAGREAGFADSGEERPPPPTHQC